LLCQIWLVAGQSPLGRPWLASVPFGSTELLGPRLPHALACHQGH